MITGLSATPNVHSLRFFETVEEIQEYLSEIDRFNAHSMAPRCFAILNHEAKEMGRDWVAEHVWPYTKFNQERKEREERNDTNI